MERKKKDIYDSKRTEGKPLIRCGKDTFISRCPSYAKLAVAQKKNCSAKLQEKILTQLKKALT